VAVLRPAGQMALSFKRVTGCASDSPVCWCWGGARRGSCQCGGRVSREDAFTLAKQKV
jgi:hypothetical protein